MNRITLRKDNGTLRLVKKESNIKLTHNTNTISFKVTGKRGLPGEKGADADKNFVATLSGQTDVVITHNLAKYPSVTVFDSAGDEIEGDYQHLDTARTRLTFSAGFSGKAIFN